MLATRLIQFVFIVTLYTHVSCEDRINTSMILILIISCYAICTHFIIAITSLHPLPPSLRSLHPSLRACQIWSRSDGRVEKGGVLQTDRQTHKGTLQHIRTRTETVMVAWVMPDVWKMRTYHNTSFGEVALGRRTTGRTLHA